VKQTWKVLSNLPGLFPFDATSAVWYDGDTFATVNHRREIALEQMARAKHKAQEAKAEIEALILGTQKL